MPPWLSKEDLEQLNREAERLPEGARGGALNDRPHGGGGLLACLPTYLRTHNREENHQWYRLRCVPGQPRRASRSRTSASRPGPTGFFEERTSPRWRSTTVPSSRWACRGIRSSGCLDSSHPGFPMAQTLVRPALNNSTNPGNDLPPWETKSVKRSPLPASLFTGPPVSRKGSSESLHCHPLIEARR